MCFETLIGLTRSECSCYPDNSELTFNINESETGIYLDKGLSLKGLDQTNCDDPNNIWQKLNAAYEAAQRRVKSDIFKGVNQMYDKMISYEGSFGAQRTNAAVTPSETYRGTRIKASQIKGAYMRITQVDAKFTTTGTTTLRIYNNVSEDEIANVTLNHTADTWTVNGSDVDLPLWNDETDEFYYYIVHDAVGYENEADCGCGRPEWKRWISIDGYVVDDLTSVDEGSSGNNMHGLRLALEFDCAVDLCGLNRELKNDLGNALAYAGKIELIEDIIPSGKIDAYTLIMKDQLIADLEHYQQKYFEWIEYLVKELPVGSCFRCKQGIGKKTILI